MPLPSDLSILDSVKQLTEERNRERLDIALVHAIFNIAPVLSVALYRLDIGDNTTMRRVHALPLPATGGEPSDTSVEPVLNALLLQALARAPDDPLPPSPTTDLQPPCFFYPLRDGEPLGVVCVQALQGRAVEARLVGGVISLYRNFVAVIDDAQRDTLTGLLNRKTFDRRLQSLLYSSDTATVAPPAPGDRRGVKVETPNWLAALDIDHFKRINDSFGHLYGDEVLILMARVMLQSFRANDLVFRMGGEEFSVLLTNCSADGALQILERFRERVASHMFPQVGQVTISIGYVQIRGQSAVATVVDHADQALYASKHAGRNRCTAYAAPNADSAESRPASSVDLF